MASQGKRLATPVLLSMLLHAAAAVIAGWIIISSRQTPEPVGSTTSGTRSQTTPSGAENEAGTHPPLSEADFLRQQAAHIRSLTRSGLAAPPLPSPEPPTAKHAPVKENIFEPPGAASLANRHAGLGSALAKGLGAQPQPPAQAPQFLGTPVTGEKIMLLFDVSKTVANALANRGIPMEKIRLETARLIDALGIHTSFGLLQFARNYALFRPELSAATRANREAAHQWLARHFSTQGTLGRNIPHTVTGSPGFLAALEHAFSLEPDTLFILSDGSFQRGTGIHASIPWDEVEACFERLQRERPMPAKVHFIGIATKPAAAENLRRILSRRGGTYSDLAP